MKILDKYIAKNFIIGYIIALMVLVGLRIVTDLFVNLDEFAQLAENAKLSAWDVIVNVFRFYGIQSTLYFRDFAGMITVVAAVFSLGKMTRSNELVAVMASGVSLKRVIGPIIVLAILFTGLLVIDQEFIIPSLANRLVRPHDALPEEQFYDIWFMADSKGALICAKQFDEKTATLIQPTIIKRLQTGAKWEVVGKISADSATYTEEAKGWELENGILLKIAGRGGQLTLDLQPESVPFYESDITPAQIPIRQQEGYKALLSSRQLSALVGGQRVKDMAEVLSQKHFRITEPIINLVMLLVALPILVCREPKAMKSAIMISFGATSACFIVTFICKMMAAEVFFDKIKPELWAWIPVFLFLPVAFIELDSMKT